MSVHGKFGKSYWFDLPAVDYLDAQAFYQALFHWKFLRMDESPLADYWVIQSGEDLIGGLRRVPQNPPSLFSPILYFTVDYLNTYSQRVKDLGGKLVDKSISLGKNRGHTQLFRDREGNLLALWAPVLKNEDSDSLSKINDITTGATV